MKAFARWQWHALSANTRGVSLIRGVTRSVALDVRYLGQGRSPFDDTRAGFTARARINRHDYGASWNSEMQDGGVVVGDDVFITIDVEAILDEGRA